MPTKRHQENLAVSGDGASFAELKRLKSDANGPDGSGTPAPIAAAHEIAHQDHDLDRSETGDALKRAVERIAHKRGQGN